MLPFEDFIQYWAAARLNLAGTNPYDPEAMLAMERAAGFTGDAPLMMYNPPWVLVLAYPFAFVEWQVARWLAFAVQMIVVLVAAERIGRAAGAGSPRDGETGVIGALTFFPVWTALRMGQFSVFQLGGVAGLAGLTPSAGLMRGATIALLLVKPQLTPIAAMLLAFWCLKFRAWRVVGGLLVTLIASSALVSLTNPTVVQDYITAMLTRPPHHFVSPTMGSVLRGFLAPSHFWLQFVPAGLGLLWGVWYWSRHHRAWNWSTHLALPLFVGCLTSGYGGWVFDLVVLLPAVVHAALSVRDGRAANFRVKTVMLAYAAIQIALLLTHSTTQQWIFVWVAPALLALYLAVIGRDTASPDTKLT